MRFRLTKARGTEEPVVVGIYREKHEANKVMNSEIFAMSETCWNRGLSGPINEHGVDADGAEITTVRYPQGRFPTVVYRLAPVS